MKGSDVNTLAMLEALRDRRFHEWEAGLSVPSRVIERKLEKLERRGYIDCGVSLRTATLTDKGRALVGDAQLEPYDLETRILQARAALLGEFGL